MTRPEEQDTAPVGALPPGYHVSYVKHRCWAAFHHSTIISRWGDKASAIAACWAHAGLTPPAAPPSPTGEAKTAEPVAGLIGRLHEIGAHYSACDRQQTIYEAASALASQAALITEAREQALDEAYAKGVMKGIALGLGAGALTAESVRDGFLSEEYAVGQPLASFSERFACDEATKAIRALIPAEAAKEPKP